MSKQGVLWGLGGLLGVAVATLCILLVAVMGTGAQNSSQSSVEPQVTNLPTGETSDYEIAESPEVEQRAPSDQTPFQPNDGSSVALGPLPSESPPEASSSPVARGADDMITAMITVSGAALDSTKVEGETATVRIELSSPLPTGLTLADDDLKLVATNDKRWPDLSGLDENGSVNLVNLFGDGTIAEVPLFVVDDMILEVKERVRLILEASSNLQPHFNLMDPGKNLIVVGDFDIIDNEDGRITIVALDGSNGAETTIFNEVDAIYPRVKLPPGVVADADIRVAYELKFGNSMDENGNVRTPLSPEEISNGVSISSRNLIIEEGKNSSAQATIVLLADNNAEETELFQLVLLGAEDRANPTTKATAATVDKTPQHITILDDEPLEYEIKGDAAIDEGAGSYTVQLQRKGRLYERLRVVPDTVTVSYTVNGGDSSPASEADFAGNAFPMGEFTFGSYDASSNEVTFTIEDDMLFEGDETFKISVSSGTTLTSTVVAIIDDDPPGMPQPVPPVVVGFDARTYRVNEASGTVELTVSVISGNLTETIRLSYAVSDVSTMGSDYTVSGDTLELSLMTPSVTISVDIIDDTSDEPEEAFRVELSGTPAGITLDPATATVTIIDNDDEEPATSLPTISLEVPDVVEESNLLYFLTATLSRPVMEQVTVRLVTGPDSTAELIADYSLLDNPGVIKPGEVTAEFRFFAGDGDGPEGDELLVLEPRVTIGDTEVIGLSRTITIRNADPRPPLLIDYGPSEIDEGGSSEIGVRLDSSMTEDLTVRIRILPSSTAKVDKDFKFTPESVLIPNGEEEGEDPFDLAALSDLIYEGDEYIVLELATDHPGVNPSLRYTIKLKNKTPLPTASLDLIAPTIMEDQDREITARLDAVAGVTVTVSLLRGAASSAVEADYELSPLSVPVAAGELTATFRLDALEDTLYELSEPLILQPMTSYGEDTAFGVPQTVTILEDDLPVVIGFDSATYSVNEASGTVELTVEVIDGVPTEDVTLTYTTAAGSATSPGDYTGANGVSIPALSAMTQSVTFRVAIMDDMSDEPEEEFRVVLSGAPAGVSFNPATATVTIIDDDEATALSISFGATMSEIEEDAANRRHGVGLKLSGPLEDEIEVTFTVAGSATRNADYTLAGDTVTIQAGDKDRIILLDVNNDDLYDGRPHETVVLRLVSATGGVTVNDTKSEHTVTITDDEDAPMVTLDPISPSVREGGVAIFTVNLSHGVDETVTLELAVSNGSSENEDYARPDSETQLSVTIGAGETTGTLSLKTNGDNVYEGDETVMLSLSATSGAENVMGLPISRELTITEENEPPVLSLSGPSTVSENDASVVFKAMLSGALLEANLEVELAVVGGDAVFGGTAGAGDYTLSPEQATIQGGQREVEFTLETNDNAISYGDKTVELELRRVSGPVVPLGVVKRTLTIEEDEAVPQLSLHEIASIREGMAGLVTATLDIASGRTITVELTPSHTDAKPADYSTPTTLIAMIPPGEFTATFTIMATPDGIYEGPEMLEFTLSVVGGGAGVTEPRSRQLLILDADPVPSISFGATDVR